MMPVPFLQSRASEQPGDSVHVFSFFVHANRVLLCATICVRLLDRHIKRLKPQGGMSMEQRAPLQSAEILWINWREKILSFTKVDGFEAKHFLSHESCLEYAFDKATDGFRVQ